MSRKLSSVPALEMCLCGVKRTIAAVLPRASSLRLRRLSRAELPCGTIEMARYLIGKTVVRDLPVGRLSGRIVETEAYPPGDAAGHAFRGETRSNQSLFLSPGHAYVHLTYGLFLLLNVSSEPRGFGGGVLLRALELLEGIKEMRARGGAALTEHKLASGPGRLARAMQINKGLDGIDLCARGTLWLGTATRPVGRIGESVRIGISREGHLLRRFFEVGNPSVSGPKRLLVSGR